MLDGWRLIRRWSGRPAGTASVRQCSPGPRMSRACGGCCGSTTSPTTRCLRSSSTAAGSVTSMTSRPYDSRRPAASGWRRRSASRSSGSCAGSALTAPKPGCRVAEIGARARSSPMSTPHVTPGQAQRLPSPERRRAHSRAARAGQSGYRADVSMPGDLSEPRATPECALSVSGWA